MILISAAFLFIGCDNDSGTSAPEKTPGSDPGPVGPGTDPVNPDPEAYVFHSSVEVLPEGTSGTYGSTGNYVYFGDWPQSAKASDVTVDESITKESGAFTYCLGSDSAWYVNCNERYFKVEPIKWRILTKNYNNSGNALLLAENILTANIPYWKCIPEIDRTIEDKTVYANNYRYSTIRAYLNGDDEWGDDYDGEGFLQSAFTEDAQEKIAVTEVDNSKETTDNSLGQYAAEFACENTNDKIFLLSFSEIIKQQFGFPGYDSKGEGNYRIRKPTDYAMANNSDKGDAAYAGGCWWLRSPYYQNHTLVSAINPIGSANYTGQIGNPEDYNIGIVPALTIKIE